MRRFYGTVGYEKQVEKQTDIWGVETTEAKYFGNIIQNDRSLQEAEKVNDDISIGNRISIVADAYAINNFFDMKWVEWMGVRWKVRKAEIQPPRIILHLGEKYER